MGVGFEYGGACRITHGFLITHRARSQTGQIITYPVRESHSFNSVIRITTRQREMVENPNDLTIIHPDHRIVAIAFHRHLGRGDIGKRQAVSTGAGPPIIVVIRNRVGSIPAAVCIAFEDQRASDCARRFFVMHSACRQPPQVIAYAIRKTDRLQRVIRITPR